MNPGQRAADWEAQRQWRPQGGGGYAVPEMPLRRLGPRHAASDLGVVRDGPQIESRTMSMSIESTCPACGIQQVTGRFCADCGASLAESGSPSPDVTAQPDGDSGNRQAESTTRSNTASELAPLDTRVPSGWYPDPAQDGRARFWSGSWTDSVRCDVPTRLVPTHEELDRGLVTTNVQQSPAAAEVVPAVDPGGWWNRQKTPVRVLSIVVPVLAAILAVSSVVGGGDSVTGGGDSVTGGGSPAIEQSESDASVHFQSSSELTPSFEASFREGLAAQGGDASAAFTFRCTSMSKYGRLPAGIRSCSVTLEDVTFDYRLAFAADATCWTAELLAAKYEPDWDPTEYDELDGCV